MYSAVFVPKEIRDRVIRVYSNDGPGFVEEVVNSPEFKEMDDRIITIVPQSSVVGMLLCRGSHLEVVESTVKMCIRDRYFSAQISDNPRLA